MLIIDYKDLTPELARKGCFVLDMPNEAYHAYEGISKSGLDLINKSPAHYMAGKQYEPTAAMRMGTLVHTAVLEPERYEREVIQLRGIKDKRASEYKAAVKEHGAENVILEKEAAQIESLQESIGHHESRALLDDCNMFEVSAFVELDGVLVRCRYDALNTVDHVSIDLKTTRCSNREEFSKSVFNFRYHVQDALYSLVYQKITGHCLAFKFLAVELEPPHNPMIYSLDGDAQMIGFLEAERNLRAYESASASQYWQGYEQTGELLSLPGWAIAQFEDQLEGEIV